MMPVLFRPSIYLCTLLIVSFFAAGASAQTHVWRKHDGTSPPARGGAVMVYDEARGETVMFGGSGDGNEFLTDTWIWNGRAWTQRQTTRNPGGRLGHVMVYDAGRREVVLFGGQLKNGVQTSDTWIWDGVDWTERTPASRPTARQYGAASYDRARQHVVLFGGARFAASDLLRLRDTWIWDGTNWVERSTATAPPGQFGHAMAYDEARSNTVLWGSEGTWIWNGTTWSHPSMYAEPPLREASAAVYHAGRQQVFSYGGGTFADDLSEVIALNDIWVWTGQGWNGIASNSAPPVRMLHGLAYHRDASQVVVFGGYGAGGGFIELGDTWIYAAPPALAVNAQRVDVTGNAGGIVAPRTLNITSQQGSSVQWTAAVSTTSGGQWLTVEPARGTGSGSITLSFNTTGLAAGVYHGSLSLSAGPGLPVEVPVTLTLTDPLLQVPANGVVNAASFQGGGVAPGEMITIYGTRLGPPQLQRVPAGINAKIPTSWSGVRLLFDNVAAPLIYVSEGQLAAIVPYAVAAKTTTQMQVEYQGSLSNSVSLPVIPARPALFTANSSGRGQAAVLNQDSSVNSATNPADKGSVVMLYGTGEGQTNPAGTDGQLAIDTLPKPVLPVSVRIGGIEAEVRYAGAAPLQAGMIQFNVVIPDGVPSGDVPVTVKVGGHESPAGVTIAVR